jgi:hypothetical protein
MTGREREDGGRQLADAIDLAIDEAVARSLNAGPVELRETVLAQLECVHEARAAWRVPAIVLRPALLPVLGALLMVAAVATLWQRADRQLSIPSPPAAGAQRTHGGRPTAADNLAPRAAAVTDAAPRAGSTTRTLPGCRAGEGGDSCAAPARPQAARARGETRVYAASLLEMDAASSPTGLRGDEDEDLPGAAMPGAPAGELGDPIAPMPRPRPIVIHPIATPPIEVAPPVSTLGNPVSTLADETGRGPQDPEKPGGVRR